MNVRKFLYSLSALFSIATIGLCAIVSDIQPVILNEVKAVDFVPSDDYSKYSVYTFDYSYHTTEPTINNLGAFDEAVGVAFFNYTFIVGIDYSPTDNLYRCSFDFFDFANFSFIVSAYRPNTGDNKPTTVYFTWFLDSVDNDNLFDKIQEVDDSRSYYYFSDINSLFLQPYLDVSLQRTRNGVGISLRFYTNNGINVLFNGILDNDDFTTYFLSQSTVSFTLGEIDVALPKFDINGSANSGLAYGAGYTNGINNVLNNPSEYNLYNYQQYTNYGVQKYNEGVDFATDNDLSFYTFLKTLFSAPNEIFKGSFNWSLPLGNGQSINMLPLMTFLLTIAIALAVVKLIIGGK